MSVDASQIEEQPEPIIVENNTTIIAPEVEQQPTEPDYSEDAIRELDIWCVDIERQLSEVTAALIELRAIIGEHSHAGYSLEGHEHEQSAHEHEEYALREHEHTTTSPTREDTPPQATHLWFKKLRD